MSPKQRFQLDKVTTAFWLDLVVNDKFLRGLDSGLLQLSHELPHTDNPETAAAAFHQLSGAKQLRRVLISLPEPYKERERTVSDNLTQPR